MKKIISFASLLLGIISISSCYYDNLAEMTPSTGVIGGSCDTSGTISYSHNIAPILQSNCGTSNSCHGTGNTSGYDLSTYTGVNAVVQNGKLINSITWSGTTPPMPQNGSKMSDCGITKIQKWVTSGAPNN